MMDGPTLITLPPHLREKIRDILVADVQLPANTRDQLAAVDVKPISGEIDVSASDYKEKHKTKPQSEGREVVEDCIDEEVLLRLARWADGDGRNRLKKAGIGKCCQMVPPDCQV